MAKQNNSKPFRKPNRFRHALLKYSIFVFLGYVALSVYGANRFTSNAHAREWDQPEYYDLRFEDVLFPSAAPDHLGLRGWWIPNPKSARVIILVHGLYENRGYMMELGASLWKQKFNLLLFDLRGHGDSGGERHSFGEYEQWDVVGAVNFVRDKGFEPASIGVLGWSLGGASALMATGKTADIQAVVSDSSYANFARLVRNQFTPLSGLPDIFLPGMEIAGRVMFNVDVEQCNPEIAVRNLAGRHIFLIHSRTDRVVPVSEAYLLQQAAGRAITDLWILPDGSHANNYFFHSAEYVRRVTTFFNRELGSS